MYAATQPQYYNPGLAIAVQPTQDVDKGLFASFEDYIGDKKDTTIKGYLTCIKQFAKWLNDQGITRPDRKDIIAYRNHLAECGYTAGTQAQYLRAVKMFFKWTSAAGLYPNVSDHLDGAKVKGEGYRRDALTEDEAETIRESIDRETTHGKMVYAMYMLGVRRGLRVVEMSRANIKDLSEKNGVMYINIWGKGHDEPDTVRALDNDTRDAIAEYLDARGQWDKSEPLFVSTSNNSKGDRILSTTISAMLKKAMVDAGFNSPRLTAHSLRHTAITMAVKCSGGNIHRGKDFARHVDPATTERYTHMDTVNDDAELVRVIENKYHGDDQDTRDALIDIITTASADDLEQLAQVVRERGLDNGRL